MKILLNIVLILLLQFLLPLGVSSAIVAEGNVQNIDECIENCNIDQSLKSRSVQTNEICLI